MTFSIVARCERTGQLGVAVATHWLATGARVPWIHGGVGAIATQGLTELTYGPMGLNAMAAGISAPEALEQLVREDGQAEFRQVAFVDNSGRTANHTGSQCIQYAEHGTAVGVAAQANLMTHPGSTAAMLQAWEDSHGDPLAWRLLCALEAAESAGGDLRGKQSAALKVADVNSVTWSNGVVIDVRVDDHPEPLAELKRLVRLGLAYAEGDRAEEYETSGDIDKAAKSFGQASDLLPQGAEMSFWLGVNLANKGRIEAAKAALRQSFADQGNWKEVLRRLPATGILDVPDEVLEDLLSS